MKRIAYFLSAIIYLFLSIGIIAHVHLCHGNISNISIHNIVDNNCDNDTHCGNNTKEHHSHTTQISQQSCCFNQTIVIQFSPEAQSASQDLKIAKEKITLSPFQNFISDLNFENSSFEFSNYNTSPPPKKSLYNLFCSYIFYG